MYDDVINYRISKGKKEQHKAMAVHIHQSENETKAIQFQIHRSRNTCQLNLFQCSSWQRFALNISDLCAEITAKMQMFSLLSCVFIYSLFPYFFHLFLVLIILLQYIAHTRPFQTTTVTQAAERYFFSFVLDDGNQVTNSNIYTCVHIN